MTTPPPPPDEPALREAALGYLARYGASKAGVLRVLRRRILRWAEAARGSGADPGPGAAAAEASARAVIAQLSAEGVLDDMAFATARATRLRREGHSARAITAHLRARGIGREALPAAITPGDDAELAAALAFARRRRLGPFGPEADGPEAGEASERRRKALGAFARAGFPRETALAALATPLACAERMIARLRQA